MRGKWFLAVLLLLLSSCALIQRPAETLQWPSDTTFLDGEGDLFFTSPQERFSGSFLVSLSYPDRLFFEVYGGFGQTLVHVERQDGRFLFIAGEEKTQDERALAGRFGFTSEELMNDLTLRGEKEESANGLILHRNSYKVIYSQDRRGKRTMCWERQDSRICLTFDKVSFQEG